MKVRRSDNSMFMRLFLSQCNSFSPRYHAVCCTTTAMDAPVHNRRRSLRLRGQAPAAAREDAPPLQEIENVVKTKKRKVPAKSAERDVTENKPKSKCTTLAKSFEERLWSKGFKRVAGVDEAGRGPLAGPVVAAACIVSPNVTIEGVTDSKQIKEADRERLFEEIMNHPEDQFARAEALSSTGSGETRLLLARHLCRSVVEADEIDSINILQATYVAMARAVKALPADPPDAVLIDGNRMPPEIKAEHTQTIVKGDSVCFSIAAASILAKVTRDRIMREADAKWPVYGFMAHKGYGTKGHMAAVRKYGPCPIHRLTFRPLPEIVAAAKSGSAKIVEEETD